MGSAGCVQNVPEALSLLCFGPNLAARVSFTLVAVELKGNSTFVMIQQMLRLCSQELPAAEADGSLPCYLRCMTCWILTLGFPEPRASCAQV